MSNGLFFERVRVRRMPGVEDSGFTLDGLVPGVNIVHGPNASGKTTSARAIELLLWPRLGQADRALLEGRFHLGDSMWSVDVDADRFAYQRDGDPAPPPTLPPAEEHDRYRLSLHELIKSENVRFARAIVQETAGGYDVPAAGTTLNPRTTASQCRTERDELKRARSELNDAVQTQENLRTEERRLGDLRAQRRDALDAARHFGVLGSAMEYASARGELETARASLAAFPAGMAPLHGDEYVRLQRIAEKLRQIDAATRSARESREAAQTAIEAVGLPDQGVEPELIAAVRSDLDALRAADQQTLACTQDRARSAVRAEEERSRLGEAVGDARLAELDHVAFEELADFAARAARAHATAAALDAELAAIGDPESAPEATRLDRGVHLLQQWLRSGEPVLRAVPTAWLVLIAAAGTVAGLGVGLGFLLNPLFYLAALAGTLAVVMLIARGRGDTADPRDLHRADYEKLGLGTPAAWRTSEVEHLLDELLDRRATERARAERGRRREQVAERRGRHEQTLAEIETERHQLTQRFGVAPGTDEGHLYWLANRISRWQDAHSDLSEAEAALEAARSGAASLREGLVDRLAPFGFDPLRTNGELAGAIEGLDRRRQDREAARLQVAKALTDLNRLDTERIEQEELRREIFTALELDEDSDDTVRSWCKRFAAYQEHEAAVRDADIAAASGRRRLEGLGADEALFESSPGDLARELVEARECAEAEEALSREITEIETRITDAKKAHDVEAALERLDRCEHRLREARTRDTRALIGNALLEYVQRTTRDERLPAVFHRAREIFSRITHGRYELRLSGEDEPVFRAWDNHAGRGRALDELSTGTRVQLLLAVRVAFVEQQEHGVRLPLVLDEVLGNSDDERACAIMEAAIQLAQDGRQIFYFTAQSDEVQKWGLVLDRYPDLTRQVIDLREARAIQRRIEIPAIGLVAFPARRIPEPGEVDHLTYGQILGVPALNRATAHPGEVHLWYLVEDPAALHHILSLGPQSWGMLEGFAANGAGRLVAGELLPRIEALGRATNSYLRECKVGIGRPVERATLIDAPAISPTFLDRMDELRQKVDGDARRIVDALENREIARFQRDKVDELREYLEEGGYLDGAEPLCEEEIRLRVLASVAGEMGSGLVSVAEIDRLIARLQVGMSDSAVRVELADA